MSGDEEAQDTSASEAIAAANGRNLEFNTYRTSLRFISEPSEGGRPNGGKRRYGGKQRRTDRIISDTREPEQQKHQ
jgi:hypothetical protein